MQQLMAEHVVCMLCFLVCGTLSGHFNVASYCLLSAVVSTLYYYFYILLFCISVGNDLIDFIIVTLLVLGV